MKVVRLTDDRYIIDVGASVTASHADAIGRAWSDWWDLAPIGGVPPKALVVGGDTIPLVYEDHRDPEGERLDRLEKKLDKLLDMLS